MQTNQPSFPVFSLIYYQNGHMSPGGVSFHTGAGFVISTNERQNTSATLLREVS